MEASTTTILLCLGNRRQASGAVVALAKGGGQLALNDTSSDGIRYPGDGVHCLIRGGRGSSSFETVSGELYGTVDENPTCSSLRRTKHINVRHDLMRDACETRKVRVVCVRKRSCSLSH